MSRGKPGTNEPNFRKLLSGVRHVLAAKDAEPEHLSRREIGLELRIEIAADGGDPRVTVVFLHSVIHDDGAFAHSTAPLFFGRSSASLERFCVWRSQFYRDDVWDRQRSASAPIRKGADFGADHVLRGAQYDPEWPRRPNEARSEALPSSPMLSRSVLCYGIWVQNWVHPP
jgi:hypothetical protein